MTNTAQVQKERNPFVYTLLYGALVIVAAQFKVSMFSHGFVISAGIIVFALLMLILDEFATIPVLLVSAVGIMVTRAWFGAGAFVGPEQIWEMEMASFAFYAIYGILVYLFFQVWEKEKTYGLTWILLMVPDCVANMVELTVRGGMIDDLAHTLAIMLGVAAVRSAIVIALHYLIVKYRLVEKLPRKGVTIREDGNIAHLHSHDNNTDDTLLAWAAQDADALYHKLQTADASQEILESARKLAMEIEKAAKSQ